jgi:acyl-coenzyme A thioesterase 13
MTDIPDGFQPLFRTSPFLDVLGPFFYRPSGTSFVIGLRVAEKHANARGTVHGGLLLTLADVALGYTAAFSEEPALSLTTANISADFAGHAKIGDWLEAHVDIQKIGRRLVFANAYLVVGTERIARASAVFARNTGALTKPSASGADRSDVGTP